MDQRKNEKVMIETLNELLERFIKLFLNDKVFDFNAWIKRVSEEVEGFCHEKRECGATDCPGYKNECGRCRLVAGTFCAAAARSRASLPRKSNRVPNAGFSRISSEVIPKKDNGN